MAKVNQNTPPHVFNGNAPMRGGIGVLANEVARGVVEFQALFYRFARRFIPAGGFEVGTRRIS
ncbi:hypothetical protein [Mycobacterium malmoense]|uniref:hypothetical protein n=1 Tax=Mycobacterium malmoense TaxID=1780 RepID=UPI0008F8470C|nr:hypothetical protein [Mycobacterium malmoense]OIN81003.1 hypothetical protein BMG05_09770 [Mycobacterium malmoense]